MAELDSDTSELFPLIPAGQSLLSGMPADAIRFDGLARYVKDGSLTLGGSGGTVARVLICNRQLVAAHSADGGTVLFADAAIPALLKLIGDAKTTVSAARIDRDLIVPLPFIWATAATYGPVPVAWFAGGIDAVLEDIGARGVSAAVMLTSASGKPILSLYKGSLRIFPAEPTADPVREQLAALASGPADARQTSQLSVWELPADWTPAQLATLPASGEPVASSTPTAAAATPTTAPAAHAAPAADSPATPKKAAAAPAAAAPAAATPAAAAAPADASGLPLNLIAATVESDIQSYLQKTGATGFAPRVQAVADEGWTCGEFFATFEKTEDIPTLDAATRATMLANWRALAGTHLAAHATT